MTRNRIDETFARCSALGRPALVLYLTSGFPDEAATRRLLPVLEAAGCDLLELGVPFSDPIADGPVIQKASTRAIERGMTLQKTLAIVRDYRAAGGSMPVVLFGALNPFLAAGLDNTVRSAASAGVDGFLAADLPVEECAELRSACAAAGLHLVLLAAPTSPPDRLARIGAASSGFLYCIARKGITGTSASAAGTSVHDYLARVRSATDLPIALGFGIQTPAQVAEAAPLVDGVVVGSALITVIEKAESERRDIAEAVRAYVASLADALTVTRA